MVVHDFGVDGDRPFIVMELVTGKCLRQLLTESAPLTPQAAADLAADILAGLAHAHEAGILHRDIKPGNVLITDSGVAKLADFGIAKSSDETVDLTDTGNIVGTISYASPEKLSGSPVGRPSDIYSLGCVLYECVAGRPPFVADNIAALVSQQQFARPESLRDLSDGTPAQLEGTIMRALEKDPGRRYNTAGAMREAIDSSGARAPTAPITSGLSIRRLRTDRPRRENSGVPEGRGNRLGSRRMFIAALVGALIAVMAVAALVLTLLRRSSPTVVVVNPVLPVQKQTIAIRGSGFGNHAAFNGVLPCIEFIDKTAGWSAGHAVPAGMGPGAGGACGIRQSDDDDAKDPVHLDVTQWTNTKIVISELTGRYGGFYEHKHCVLVPGDIVSVRVWNAESGDGPGGSSTTVVY